MAKYLNLDGLKKLFKRILQFRLLYPSTSSGSGTSGWVCIGRIKCNNTYMNTPFIFKIISRGYSSSIMEVMLSPSSGKKPGIAYMKHHIKGYNGTTGKTSNVGYTYEDVDDIRTYTFWKKKNEGYGTVTSYVECRNDYSQFVSFPNIFSENEPEGIVYASEIVDDVATSCTGNSATSTKATQDGDGNIITSTYAKKSELPSVVSKTDDGLCPQLPNETTTTKYLRQDGTWSVPPNDNTDTKVTQTVKSDNAEYPILLAPASQTTTQTTTACFDSGVKLNPSTDAITAKEYKGKIISINSTGGTNTAAVTTSPYKPNIWKFNASITATDGMLVSITAPSGGHSNGVFLSLNNGTNYYPIVLNGTGRLTTHYPNGSQLLLAFDSDGSASSIYPLNGAEATTTVTGGVWRVINYYDANSNDTRSGLATCSTAAGTAAKTATMPNFAQPTNCMILLQVTVANTVASKLTLNVNGQGAKDVKINGTITSSTNYSLPIGYYWAKYDGTYWNLTKLEFTDTTYSSKTAASGGTDVSLVTTGEKYNWDSKYAKPKTGIPKRDLSNDVSDSLDKGDEAYNSMSVKSIAPPTPDYDTSNKPKYKLFEIVESFSQNSSSFNLYVGGTIYKIYSSGLFYSKFTCQLKKGTNLDFNCKFKMSSVNSTTVMGYKVDTISDGTNKLSMCVCDLLGEPYQQSYVDIDYVFSGASGNESIVDKSSIIKYGDDSYNKDVTGYTFVNNELLYNAIADINLASNQTLHEPIVFGYRGTSINEVNPDTTTGTINSTPYLVACYNTGTSSTLGTTYYKDVKASNVKVGDSDKIDGWHIKVNEDGNNINTIYFN